MRRDARESVKALIVANEFLEHRLAELASPAYAHGRVLPRERIGTTEVARQVHRFCANWKLGSSQQRNSRS